MTHTSTGKGKPLHYPISKEFIAYLYIIITSAAYFSYWSYVSVSKYLALHDHVFDLGLAAQRGWVILHTNIGVHEYLMTAIRSGIVYPLSPLTGSGNYFAILLFQVFSVTIVASGLYRISRIKGLSITLSLAVVTAYFLYYPIYGIFWFDFHYQVMFLPLFVFAYMFYLEGKFGISLVFFSLSGLVRFPYCIFPLSFALIELVIIFYTRRKGANKNQFAMIGILSIGMFILTTLGLVYLNGISSIGAYVSSISNTFNSSTLADRFLTLTLILAPLLFLPALSIRWLLLTTPFIFVVLTSNYFGYTFPFILQDQYISGAAPFLMLGFIETLSSFYTNHSRKSIGQFLRSHPTRRNVARTLRTIAILFAVVILLNLVYAPFGPYNSSSADKFNFGEKTSYNMTVNTELDTMLGLIPSQSPYIVYQDNLPQVLPRPLPDSSLLLLAGYLGNMLLFNSTDVISNTWPVVLPNGTLVSVPINYALADPENPNFYYGPVSMYSVVSTMYESGKYGILAEGAGLILLERGYNGSVLNYIQHNVTYQASVFTNYLTNTSGHSVISATNDNNGLYLSYGPGTYLYPGNYSASFMLNSGSLQVNNSLWLQVTADRGSNLICFEQINGTSFKSANNYQQFVLKFHITEIYGYVEFRIWGMHWKGNISFKGVRLTQDSVIE